MNRGIITISETGVVIVPTAPIWMTKFEIADMFGVFSYDIRKAIRAIYKNKELNEAETMRYIRQPDGISYDVYNFEMIIKQYPGLNSSKIARLIGKSVPTAKRYLNSLVRLDLIEFRGAQKNGGYYWNSPKR